MNKNYRDMISSVLWQVERDLIDFLRNENQEIDEKKLYLDDYMRFVLSITKNEAIQEALQKTKGLFDVLEIATIRNRISHANHNITIGDWYAVAAFASNPDVLSTGIFKKVLQKLSLAEEGYINPPSEEWLSHIPQNCIPNNLPDHFDHAITGFIGRNSERKSIIKALLNPRCPIITITGPGGMGKTAIVFEILKQLSFSHVKEEPFDSIIYVSLKTEELTSEGVKKISFEKTIENVKNEIKSSIEDIYDESFSSFEEAVKIHSSEKILLFIDNLETLLSDSPSDFENFNYSLPSLWKLVITSRINLSFGNNIPLETMKSEDAYCLAKQYAEKKGISQALSEKHYEKIADCLEYNPLAIRLCLEYLVLGGELNQSLQKVSIDVVNYSYKNLLERLLPTSKKILELLFINSSTKSEALEVIEGVTNDEFSEAIQQLLKTNLVIFDEDDDEGVYRLTESVKNCLEEFGDTETRAEICLRVKEKGQQANIQKNYYKGVLDTWSLSAGASLRLKKIVIAYKKSKKKDEGARSIYKRLKAMEETENNSPEYWRIRSFCANKIYALEEVENCINRIKTISGENSAIYLGELLTYKFGKHEYSDAEIISKRLMDNKNHFCLTDDDILRLYPMYLKTLVFQDKTDEVLELTKKWKSITDSTKIILGLGRVLAHKRIAEQQELDKKDNLHNAIELIYEISKMDISDNSFYKYAISQVLREIFREMEIEKNKQESKEEYINFVMFCLENKISTLYSNDVEDVESSFEKLINRGRADISHIKNDDRYKQVIVYAITTKDKGYVFANDENKNQFFIHFNNVKNIGKEEWSLIHIGVSLWIIPNDNDGKKNTQEAWLDFSTLDSKQMVDA